MKFAINYSPQAADLLLMGDIQIDYFKCPNWPYLVAEASAFAPPAVHFDLTAGSGQLDERSDWGEIETLLSQTKTPFVNVHLDPPLKQFPGLAVDAPTQEEEERIITALEKDLQTLVQRFGAENIIAENAPYHAKQGHVIRTAAQPAVIRQVIESARVSLLLDLSHAAISAEYMGMSEDDYFAGLPLDKVREMHFTGIHDVQGRRTDHLPALPADWKRLDWALAQIENGRWGRPWMLAFEYGGVGKQFEWRSERAAIAEQVPVLYKKVSRAI